jgi:hypothetical protein
MGRAQVLPPLTLISQAIPHLSRDALESLTERLIDYLDQLDAPAEDMEDDDPAGQCDEDEMNTGSNTFAMQGRVYVGPGCPISDDDCDCC